MTQILYKFLTVENAFRVLEQRKLKVSLIRELNDVYDCAPRFDSPKSPDEEVYQNAVMQELHGVGLVCFSKSCSSPLLWGHYSASATGVALGFEADRLNYGEALEVRYESSRPILSSSTLPPGTPDPKRVAGQICFGTKAREWAYEQEVRFLVALANCEPQVGMYFIGFYPVALKQVVIGYRSSVDIKYFEHYLNSNYKGMRVSVHKASVHPTNFEMTIA